MEPIEIKAKRTGLEKEQGSASKRLPGIAIIMVLTLIVFGNWIAVAMAAGGNSTCAALCHQYEYSTDSDFAGANQLFDRVTMAAVLNDEMNNGSVVLDNLSTAYMFSSSDMATPFEKYEVMSNGSFDPALNSSVFIDYTNTTAFLDHGTVIIPNGSGIIQYYLDVNNSVQDAGFTVDRNVSNINITSNTTETITVTVEVLSPKAGMMVALGFANDSNITATPVSWSQNSVNTSNMSTFNEANSTIYMWIYKDGVSVQTFEVTVNYTINNTLGDIRYKPNVRVEADDYTVMGSPVISNYTFAAWGNDTLNVFTDNTTDLVNETGDGYVIEMNGTLEPLAPMGGSGNPSTCAALCHQYEYSTDSDFFGSVQLFDRVTMAAVLNDEMNNGSVLLDNLSTSYMFSSGDMTIPFEDYEVLSNGSFDPALNSSVFIDYLNTTAFLDHGTVIIPNGSGIIQYYFDVNNSVQNAGFTVDRNVSNINITSNTTENVTVTVEVLSPKAGMRVALSFINDSNVTATPVSWSQNSINASNMTTFNESDNTVFVWFYNEGVSVQTFEVTVSYTVNKTVGDIRYKPNVRVEADDYTVMGSPLFSNYTFAGQGNDTLNVFTDNAIDLINGTGDGYIIEMKGTLESLAPMGGGGGGSSGFGSILLNQGFEELTLGQPDNWTLSGTAFVTNSSSSEGNNSLFINANENGDIIFANQTLDVYDVSGMNFTFIVNMTHSGGANGDAISFYLNYVDINATPQSQLLMIPSLSDTSGSIWNKYIVNLTVPDDTFNISGFEIRTNGTGEYWIDDLKLIMDYKYQYWNLYQNYSMVIKEIDVDGELLWLATEKDHIEVDDSVVNNQTTYEYHKASDLILNGTVNYIKPYNNNKTYLVQITDVWQFSDTNGSVLINGTYNTFLRGDQYHDPKVMPSGSAVLDINEFTGDVFSFDMGEVENELIMVKGDGALRFTQSLMISGNLLDMGTTPIDNIIEAPDSGYVTGPITPLIGNTYCVNNSGKYGKFEIADVTSDNILIHWSYQPNGSRYFMHGDFEPPVITIISPVNMTYNVADVNLNYTVSEPTNAVWYSLDGGANTTLLGNTTLTNLSPDWHNLFVFANDTSDNLNASNVSFRINAQPLLTPVGIVNVNESESLLITLDATDPNSGDTLIYSTNATFGTLTGNNFTWTPNLTDVGIYYVDFGVSDGVLFNNTTAIIIVSDSKPPVLTILSPQNQTYNTDTVALNYTVSEPTNAVWYKLDGGANVSLSGNTTLVSLTPNWHNLYVFANDTSDNLNFSNVSFYINAPPNLVPVGTVYGNETEQLNITLNATDPNGGSLTFSTNASYGTLVGNNYTWTPNLGEAGTYYVDFGVSDGVLVNNTTATIVIQDNNPPVISGIVDVNITTHTATIEWNTDEGSYSEVSFGTESGNYTDSVSDTTLVTSHRIDLSELMWSTTYYYNVTSTDQAGNTNQSIEYNFTTPYNYETAVSSIENNTKYINATNNTDTNVEFVPNQNVSGNINITLSSNISELVNITNPLNSTYGLVSGDTPVEKYFQVNVSGNLSSENVSWAMFKLYYTIADLDQNGDGDADDAGIDLDESKLTIYWYNESGDWIKLVKDLNLTAYGGPYVYDAGVNTTDTDVYAGYAWVNKSGFSTFALVSSPIVKSDKETTGGGGGGGGGGGTSGEAFENILIQENDRQSVFKDNDVAYSFEMEGNIVRYVNFTSLTSSGTIVSKVEILNHTSTMVDIPAPDSVFKNLNIWLGNLGWASDRNIKDVTITFEVNRSWIQENNIDPDTLTLSRYTNDTGTPTWLPLQTTLVAEEDEVLVYMSITSPDGFGNFAVVGVEIGSQPQSTPTPVVTSTGTSSRTPVVEPTPIGGSNFTWVIIGFVILLLVAGVGYMERDLITKWLNERRP